MDEQYIKSFENTDPTCPICKPAVHELSECPKFKRLLTLKCYAIVRLSKACFHCLKRGHPMQTCGENPGRFCGIEGCKRCEHPLLHADASTKKIPYSEWNDVTHGSLIWEESDGDIPVSLNIATVARLAQEGEIGIQTAVVNLSNDDRKH